VRLNSAPATRSEAPSDLGRGLLHVVCARICARPIVSVIVTRLTATRRPSGPKAVQITRAATTRAVAPGCRQQARISQRRSRANCTANITVSGVPACPARDLAGRVGGERLGAACARDLGGSACAGGVFARRGHVVGVAAEQGERGVAIGPACCREAGVGRDLLPQAR
jgi:hypothetical protein